jgi:GT2 family glycosyltransferase
MPKLSINIVAWNDMDFIPTLLESIFAQTFTDFAVRLIDNGSTDGLEAYVREHHPSVTILRNARNLGFSPAHNQGIRYAIEHWHESELPERFVLITNPDVIMPSNFLKELMRAAEADREAGSFQGKLLRAYIENAADESLKETVRSDRLDSTGLVKQRNRTFTDRGAGELDTGQYDADRDIFGVTGALALYRGSALQDVRYRDEFFDHDFFLYKEDVDLAWRLKRAGWPARYVPEATAFHYRGAFGKEKMGWLERIRNRRGKGARRNWFSTRNHLLLLLKNEPFWSGLLALPWIAWFELCRLAYVCLFEPGSLTAYLSAIRLAPKIILKRVTQRLNDSTTQ